MIGNEHQLGFLALDCHPIVKFESNFFQNPMITECYYLQQHTKHCPKELKKRNNFVENRKNTSRYSK